MPDEENEMWLRKPLKDFRPLFDKVGEALGWESNHDMQVIFDAVHAGDIILSVKSYDLAITGEAMDEIREAVPEAEKVEFFPPDNPEEDKPRVWIYLDEGEKEGKE